MVLASNPFPRDMYNLAVLKVSFRFRSQEDTVISLLQGTASRIWQQTHFPPKQYQPWVIATLCHCPPIIVLTQPHWPHLSGARKKIQADTLIAWHYLFCTQISTLLSLNKAALCSILLFQVILHTLSYRHKDFGESKFVCLRACFFASLKKRKSPHS